MYCFYPHECGDKFYLHIHVKKIAFQTEILTSKADLCIFSPILQVKKDRKKYFSHPNFSVEKSFDNVSFVCSKSKQ